MHEEEAERISQALRSISTSMSPKALHSHRQLQSTSHNQEEPAWKLLLTTKMVRLPRSMVINLSKHRVRGTTSYPEGRISTKKNRWFLKVASLISIGKMLVSVQVSLYTCLHHSTNLLRSPRSNMNSKRSTNKVLRQLSLPRRTRMTRCISKRLTPSSPRLRRS